ncbi:MAG: MATE family efflux transporter, partial [candidate division Zixibacteria bacterium]|nr:MATE family efflux transporter [candidate division Zixibacteria bacterium]
MNKTDNITSGPITRTVFSLAVPVVLGMLMEFALASTDYFWVGKLGATAQDAITSSMVVIWTIFATISLVSVGVTALVARYVGAKELDRVVFYIRQGVAMAIGMALLFSVAGYFLTPSMLRFMDTGDATMLHAVPYLRIFFLSSVFFFLTDTAYAVFRASGDTRTPTKVSVMVVLLNMALDPLLIFGWGPVPALGVAGASLASAIALGVGSTTIIVRMLRGGLGYKVTGLVSRLPQFGHLLKIAKIGLPVSTQQFVLI